MVQLKESHYLAWVGLGASLGDRLATLASACQSLARVDRSLLELCASSSVYATSPVGPARSEFFNGALRLRTHLPPQALLSLLLQIESLHGRTREIHWGDRSLDLDLLLVQEHHPGQAPRWVYEHSPELRLPHPRIWERDFVLVPLAELNPELRVRGRSLGQWCDALDPRQSTLRRRVAGADELLVAACGSASQEAGLDL